MPLRRDRAVIAARILTARLRTARRTGRPLYGQAAHQPTAPYKQLLLFAQEQPPTAARPAVDLATLRTDLEALELTAGAPGALCGRAEPAPGRWPVAIAREEGGADGEAQDERGGIVDRAPR
ncbi:hypothetical protein [Streptomyces sp. DH10]|uniref:hypothetical protein n=1 Tax=Streptomyces sp. DH10 TaxID=3040121 RepID=UPI002441A8E3|nr:hypothetical protein [Streptomyces sp. DH10]MDG9710579.1 hypothetical protein [Streptomyces sp. DH10]